MTLRGKPDIRTTTTVSESTFPPLTASFVRKVFTEFSVQTSIMKLKHEVRIHRKYVTR